MKNTSPLQDDKKGRSGLQDSQFDQGLDGNHDSQQEPQLLSMYNNYSF